MKKRLICLFLTFVLVLGTVFSLVGCVPFNKTFIVTFKLGAPTDEVRIIEGELVQEVSSASEIEPPALSRTNWVHVGWDAELDKITSDTTVTAIWGLKNFTVTFEPNSTQVTNVTDELKYQTVKSPDKLTPPEYLRPGYTVVWDENAILKIKENTTVCATWVANTYEISFADAEGNKLNDLQEVNVVYDSKVGQLPTMQDTILGRFAGWKYTSQAGVEGVIINSETIWEYPTDAILTATWIPLDAYIIEYNNAFTHSNPTSYRTSSGDLVIQAPTRKGYEFLGWTEKGQTEKKLNVTIPTGSSGDVELTAHWQAKNFTITFDARGGSAATQTLDVLFDSVVGQMPQAEKGDWVFIGWETEDGTLITADTQWLYDKNVTLYARYVGRYSIKFVLTCIVKKETVICKIPKQYILDNGLEKSDTEENVYYLRGLSTGQALPALPVAITSDPEEYGFYCWRYNGVDKTAGTIINETNFPGSSASGVITLNVACYAVWTGFH